MNRVLSLLAFYTSLAACSTLTPVPAYSQDGMVSLDDVVLLAQSEISDQTILTFLRYRQLDFVLDAKGVQRLREAGVSEDVIQYLLEQDATPLAVLPTYVVSSGYRTGYPSYYYSPRFVGITVFPLGWYNHHYFGFGYAADHHGLNHHLGHSLGHRVGDHRNHDLGLSGGHVGRHRSVHGGARHFGHNSGHVGRHRSVHGGARHFGRNSGHVGRHRSAHGSGHSGSHHGGHGGGH